MGNYISFINYINSNTIAPTIDSFDLAAIKGNGTQIVDSSVNETSEDFSWGFLSVAVPLTEEQKLERLENFKTFFVDRLLNEDFLDDEDTELMSFVQQQMSSNRIVFLTWINNLFWEYQRNERFLLKLLDLIMILPFDDVQPQASDIALACKVIKSKSVQSKCLSLLGHWCNQRALEIISNFEEPDDPWLSIKYNRLKEVIQERCTTLEK